MKTVDLFGVAVPNLYEQSELLAGRPIGEIEALAELRERARITERNARLRPNDEHLQHRAAVAKAEYLRLRDRNGKVSADEIRAERIATQAINPLPTDNAELFG